MLKKVAFLLISLLLIIACVIICTACIDTEGECNHNYIYEFYDSNKHIGICTNCDGRIEENHSYVNNHCDKCDYTISNGEENPPTIVGRNCSLIYDANGGVFSDGKTTFQQTIAEESLLTIPLSPTKQDYTFIGWSKSKTSRDMWQFDVEKISQDTTLYAVWVQKIENAILFDGTTIEDCSIFMLVENNVTEVNLDERIVCNEDYSWKLCYGNSGQNEIVDKIAVQPSGELDEGDNKFYLIVTSKYNHSISLTIEVKIHRSHLITIDYLDNNQNVLKSVSVYSGYEYIIDYIPEVKGYVFNYWENSAGEPVSTFTPYYSTQLVINRTAKTYMVTFDVNGGDELEETSVAVTYGEYYTLPQPNKTNYTFCDWFIDAIQVTCLHRDEFGNFSRRSLSPWSYTEDKIVVAKWKINEYELKLEKNNEEAGNVYGSGRFDYGSEVTISTEFRVLYEFLGWYDNSDNLISNEVSYSFVLEKDTTYTAKWAQRHDFDIFEYTYIEYTPKNYKLIISGLKDKSVSNINIPDGATEISSNAFANCTEIVTVNIPDSVTAIGQAAFSGCSGLTSITLPFVGSSNDGTVFTSIGYIFGATYRYENITYVPKSLKTVVITGGTSIDSEAFYNCSGLESVIISDSVTSIGDSAFYSCSALTSLIIGNSVTSIGELAFGGCIGIKSITIPDSVTSIGRYSFSGCSGLESITIGNSVTSIGERVFGGCSGLESIAVAVGNIKYHSIDNCIIETASKTLVLGCKNSIIPTNGSITNIGDSAFSGCSELTIVTIPNSVTSIGKRAFDDCSGLESISIPNSVTSIGDSAFSGCSGLTNITIPNGVTSIGSFAFSDCSGLTSITIPNSVTSIGGGTFSSCSGLTSITLPFVGSSKEGTTATRFGYIFGASSDSYNFNGDYVPASLKTVVITGGTSIGDHAFYGCSGLTSIMIPDSVTSLGEWAFYDCSGLESITIGNSVTSIGKRAFDDCRRLESITIPNSVKSIGDSAFSGCSGLTSITIPFVGASKDGTAKTHFGYIFGASSHSYNSNNVPSSLKTVVITGGTRIVEDAFYKCSGLTSISILKGITNIYDGAFRDCSGLTSLTIGDNVTSIKCGAFRGCSGLLTVNWNAIDCAVDRNNPSSEIFENCTNLTTLNVGENVKTIPAYLFKGCTSLTSINLLNGVTSIGDYAFYGCGGLTSMAIPNSVESIGDYAFYGCSRLTSMTIPNSVESIGIVAFSGCSGLESITIPNSVKSIGYRAFYGCNGLLTVNWNAIECSTVGGGSTSTGEIFNGCVNLVTVSIGENVRIIPAYVFYGCSGLTSITIPNSVTSIGDSAFNGCSGLRSITIPNSVTSIGGWAFRGCIGLTSITIPDSVTSISSAFYECSGLRSITIPNSVTSIGGSAFYNCSGLESITIPDSVTSIGDSAFWGCSGLTSITIPNSVTSIERAAFYYCIGLTSITIPFVGANKDGTANTHFEYIFGAWETYNGSYVPSSLKTVVITGGTSLGSSAFYKCSGLTSITIPNSVTSIGSYAFSNCSGLESVIMPNSVTSIGDSAFEGTAWYNNQSDGVVYAGKVLYEYKGTVPANSAISVENGTKGIADSAFSGCRGLTSIIIPNSVTIIGKRAFNDCDGLTSITIPNSVTSLGDSAFYSCDGLTNLTIGNGVTSIGDSAFYWCDHLTRIDFSGTKAQWNAISKGTNWKDGTGDFTVYCSDGEISKADA